MDRILFTFKILVLFWIAHSLILVVNPIWWINTIIWFVTASLIFVAYQIIMSMFARPVEPKQQPQLNNK